MRNRVPVPAAERPPIPAFTPVPRKYRHDGWTPERQKAFIEALADTGSVTRAAAQVNMAQANCYALRRAPGAEGFRRAWEAALDFGVKRLKDLAFERAVEGELVPVFVAGRLMGFRRKRNDALLMFCLRHYGEDANGKRTTINYFSTRATAGAVQGGVAQNESAPPPPPAAAVPLPIASRQGGMAEASTTTVRTVISGSGGAERGLDAAGEVLNGFEGVRLDAEAHAAIAAALEACAARAREAQAGSALAAAEDDPAVPFVRLPDNSVAYAGQLVLDADPGEYVEFDESEPHWTNAGAEVSEHYREVAEKAGMLAPAEPAALARPKRKGR